MNSKQKRVLVIGTALVALMLLFPPWNYHYSDMALQNHAGYHFFLTPPVSSSEDLRSLNRSPGHSIVRMNTARLKIQLLITIPTMLGLAILFHTRRSKVAITIGVLFLLSAAFVLGLTIWLTVEQGLEYGYWTLP